MANPFVGKVCVPKIGFRGKPTFQKEKNRYLKKIDSDKNFRGQFSVRNFRSYFINYSARENFITKIQYSGFSSTQRAFSSESTANYMPDVNGKVCPEDILNFL